MKKYLKLLLIIFVIYSCKKSEEKNDEIVERISYPKMIFDSKIVKFNNVTSGDILTAEYKFTNPTTDTLKIKYVNPDCVCTDYSVSSKVILPNEQGVIKLKFDTKERVGENTLNAVVNANTKTKFYKLTLKAFID